MTKAGPINSSGCRWDNGHGTSTNWSHVYRSDFTASGAFDDATSASNLVAARSWHWGAAPSFGEATSPASALPSSENAFRHPSHYREMP